MHDSEELWEVDISFFLKLVSGLRMENLSRAGREKA